MIASTEDDIPSDPTTIVAPLGNEHSHTVIFLHGREDFGEDLAKYFFDSKSSDGKSLAEIFPSVKWGFPTAGLRHSAQRDFEFSSSSFAEALKGEEIISQWFDMWKINTPDEKQELMIPGLVESMRIIIEIIKEEAQSVPLERIILDGTSQGCATAVHTLLSSGLNIGGFIGTIETLPNSSSKNNTKIFKYIQNDLETAEDDESNEKP
jgi:predicted esterase